MYLLYDSCQSHEDGPKYMPIGVPEGDVEEPYLEGDDLPPDSLKVDKDAPDSVPPPVELDVYRAQNIVKHRVIRGKPLYRIRYGQCIYNAFSTILVISRK